MSAAQDAGTHVICLDAGTHVICFGLYWCCVGAGGLFKDRKETVAAGALLPPEGFYTEAGMAEGTSESGSVARKRPLGKACSNRVRTNPLHTIFLFFAHRRVMWRRGCRPAGVWH
jgi:hypothetical protein